MCTSKRKVYTKLLRPQILLVFKNIIIVKMIQKKSKV